MAKSVYQQTVVDNATGEVVPSAQITIRLELTGALAPLWEDRDGSIPMANPFTAGDNGFFQVYLNPGRYRITAVAGSFSAEPLRNYLIFSEDLVNIGDVSSFILEQAGAAAAYRDEAREWAIADENEPVGGSPGLFSSFHYAMQASYSAAEAEEWANAPYEVPVSGSPDQYSAMHWAMQAEINALAAPDIAEAIDNSTEIEYPDLDDDIMFAVVTPVSPLSLEKVAYKSIKQSPEFNYLINPEFAILQRGANSSVNDDTYVHDRWYVLSDGNGIIGVDTGSTSATGAKTTALFTSPSGTDAKFGYAQIVSSELTTALRGSVASLSARLLEIGATSLTDFKMAIIEWTGTADSVTSDFISSWNGAGVDPTLIANAAYCGTPVAFSSSASVVTKLENASISSGANNLIVFFWYNNTPLGVTDQIHLIMPKLQEGPRCTPFTLSKRPLQQEVALCERFYQKSYDLATNPGTATGVGSFTTKAISASTVLQNLNAPLRTRMRAVPTVTWYSINGATAARIRNVTTGADMTVNSTTDTGQGMTGYVTTSAAPATADRLAANWTADAEL